MKVIIKPQYSKETKIHIKKEQERIDKLKLGLKGGECQYSTPVTMSRFLEDKMYMSGDLLLWTPDMRDSLWNFIETQLHNKRKNRSRDPDNPTKMNQIQFSNIY